METLMLALVGDGSDLPRALGVYALYAPEGDGPPLYVGVAATQFIRDRWRKQHLRPRSGGSALRRSLGVFLGLVSQKLRLPARYYDKAVEEVITEYLTRCRIAVYPTSSAEEARELEKRLIAELRPVLNVRR